MTFPLAIRRSALRSTEATPCLIHPQQLLLARLGIFVGGWTLAAAEVIGGLAERTELDVLEGLLLHSLVRRVDTDGEPRYFMLETDPRVRTSAPPGAWRGGN